MATVWKGSVIRFFSSCLNRPSGFATQTLRRGHNAVSYKDPQESIQLPRLRIAGLLGTWTCDKTRGVGRSKKVGGQDLWYTCFNTEKLWSKPKPRTWNAGKFRIVHYLIGSVRGRKSQLIKVIWARRRSPTLSGGGVWGEGSVSSGVFRIS